MKKTFIAKCPDCGKEFSVSESWNGKEIECPKCRYRFEAQAPASGPKITLKTKLKVISSLAAVRSKICWKERSFRYGSPAKSADSRSTIPVMSI